MRRLGVFAAGCAGLLLAACSQQAIRPEPAAPSAAAGKPEIPPLRVTLREPVAEPAKEAATEKETATQASDDLWRRLFSLYRLPEIDHPRIDAELRWYQAHPEYIARVQRRARPYLYTIVTEIERQHLPGELALLPVVESAFKPDAYSHRRAAGLWQFIPSTGRLYGLKQNWWIDLRRDVHASTRAAIRYLKKLHTDFHGDWLLALAAYNAGEGTVMRAIRRNRRLHRPTDFWHLRLPRETRAYVPKLLAVARLFAHAKEYGIALEPIPNRPLYAVVELDSQLDLTLAAKLAEMPLEELYRLNPGYRRWVTAPDGPHRLILPLEKVELFEERLAELPQSERVRWARHQVQRGETLSQIAHRYGTPVAAIKQTNRLRSHRIYPGQQLLIPVAPKSAVLARLRPPPVKRRSAPVRRVHVVRRGDTLWQIARRYGVRVGQLARWNGLDPRDPLRPGQRLKIRGGAAPILYTVRKGDSLYEIARRFGVRLQDLRSWNQVRRTIHPGQRLKLYVEQASS
ncbi:membrane-bound lytic murein transglycosylase D [Methylomarinovum caldicuralii]|uniref:Membrane-bound lytic murein transglycosylase D n=1 Tax=Methylomarinovum caldicuralii TaxID=438856 RepID=A0AAU9C031_9GAMM|nr:LysM peptidoglycan-binding domain-containing protein [Methylomarinovum caldicuralii]BCX80893.1 membrane-bound lytic murein transglycosylase D [Methylomarinovum caldicuralii]